MAQTLVRRQCQSQKDCSDCNREIALGEYYYTNPNISICESCKKIRDSTEPTKVVSTIPDIENPGKHNDYTGKCKFCDRPQKGEMNHAIVCEQPECSDKAFTESV